ncbi:MAG TPA: hypothetical protein PK957_02630 [Candidatus Dojkabacteria bacterium]|nr:hypothetical protein [Candidatus Dojkabacteria bacterium]HQF36622.1 hypothetical protein [Candidatus Dojkabacteria bacterium]
MKKELFNKYKIYLIYCLLISIIFPALWGLQVLILLLGWHFICFITVIILHKNNKANGDVLLVMVIYPLFVIFTKFMMANNWVSYDYLNRIEHFLFSFVLSFVVWRGFLNEKQYMRILLVLGVINLIGVFNEFFEYIIRELGGFDKNFAVWVYQDTIIDLVINFLASTVFCLVVNIKRILNLKE